MSAIAKIEAKLAKYPGVASNLTQSGAARTITVLPGDEGGFAVSLTETHGRWTVNYEGWHEEFGDEGEALNCFAFGLSSECRLRVEYRGRVPVKWTVESLDGGEWVEDSTTELLHPFFWRRPVVRHFQNRLLPAGPTRPTVVQAT